MYSFTSTSKVCFGGYHIMPPSFDHLVGAAQQREWEGDAERH
jgi:hypothetical protein